MIEQLKTAAVYRWEVAFNIDVRRTIDLAVIENGIVVEGEFASDYLRYRTIDFVSWEQLDTGDSLLLSAIWTVGQRLQGAAEATPVFKVQPADAAAPQAAGLHPAVAVFAGLMLAACLFVSAGGFA